MKRGWGWGGGGGGSGWEAEGSLNHPWPQGQSHCVFSKTQKQPQCTYQAKAVAGSSLTSHAALLVHPSGTRYPTVDCHEFTGSEKCCLRKQTWLSLALSLVCLDSAGVWLSCKLDFSSCVIMLGFGKSSHIFRLPASQPADLPACLLAHPPACLLACLPSCHKIRLH